MSTVRNGYVIGSAAQTWERPVAPRREPSPRREPAQQTRTMPRPKTNPAVRLIMQVLIGVVLFGACSGVVFMRSMVSRAQLDVNAIKGDISKLETENSRLIQEKDMSMDIQHVQDAASGLGMNYPSSDQIRYIQPIGSSGEEAAVN